jgi:hypothetical protein
MSTDIPLDDLRYGPEHFDADRLRALDASRRARGVRRTVTAAQAPDGRLVAYTDIFQSATVAWYAGWASGSWTSDSKQHCGSIVLLSDAQNSTMEP